MSSNHWLETTKMGRIALSLLPEGHFSRVLGASALLGVLVGFSVAVFEWVTVDLILHSVQSLPLGLQVVSPMVGLGLGTVILYVLGNDCGPSTSDEYITAFHERQPRLDMKLVPVRLLSGAATIGFGGALGLEGPSVYAGAAMGIRLKESLDRWLGRDAARLLLTAGAASGISAVFQTPATGVIFALEAPYREDLANRALLPALIASATAYLTFISVPFVHASTLLHGASTFTVGGGELAGAVLLGMGAGFGGRVFAFAVRRAKKFSYEVSPLRRVTVGGVLLGALALFSARVFEEPLSLGPGFGAVEWVTGNHTVWLVLLLFFVRAIATLITISAGGTGGLFIPLAVQGVLLGSLVPEALEEVGITVTTKPIWPILGLAAFLAAGYRTPIAAVMFVAEATGGGSVAVVPALIAAAVSQLVAADASVSKGQKTERIGHLEHRLTLPIASALNTEVLTVPPDATISEFVWFHAVGRRKPIVPVVDKQEYLGLCSVDQCAQVDRDQWDLVTVSEVLDNTVPRATPAWTIRDAVSAMDNSGWEMLPVLDNTGGFIGIVQASEIVKLEQILEETGGAGPT